ncbi:MAG TPA: class I SAM-dependent methyltransferase [Gaiellaceae bacterium]|jgi:ubiquinone/menaquinone biosynthesis C-methylase UbiE|nr:class I SAM-dependent methyltransferase [Gaiellaceae bacterium]
MSGSDLRDTRSFYLGLEPEALVADAHVRWVRQRAGRELLDYGCATGGYCLALARHGFHCRGVDVNEAYVERARAAGVEAELVAPGAPLPFPDASFDTVLLFEVLEHVPDHRGVLAEARRVARRNVLVTVPNNRAQPLLREASLSFDHMLDVDHVNFFTRETLEEALAAVFPAYRVEEREHKDLSLYLRLFPKPVAALLGALVALRVVRPRLSYRLFAEALVDA